MPRPRRPSVFCALLFAAAWGCSGPDAAAGVPTTKDLSAAAHEPAAADSRPFEHEGAHGAPQIVRALQDQQAHSQSPINVLRGKIVPSHHELVLHLEHTAATFVKHKQHTVQVDFEAGATIRFDDLDYQLRQLHFHTPSEHRVDGMTYPMEMHIVHTRPGPDAQTPTEYLVVAILFRMGEPNHFVQSFLDATPPEVGARNRVGDKPVYMEELFPKNSVPEYFHYRGSLTTPPYTEAVQWLLLKHDLEASPEQIQRVGALEGDNSRKVQDLFDRVIDG